MPSKVIWSRSVTGPLACNSMTGVFYVKGAAIDEDLAAEFHQGDSVTYTCELVREGDLLVKREFVRKSNG